MDVLPLLWRSWGGAAKGRSRQRRLKQTETKENGVKPNCVKLHFSGLFSSPAFPSAFWASFRDGASGRELPVLISPEEGRRLASVLENGAEAVIGHVVGRLAAALEARVIFCELHETPSHTMTAEIVLSQGVGAERRDFRIDATVSDAVIAGRLFPDAPVYVDEAYFRRTSNAGSDEAPTTFRMAAMSTELLREVERDAVAHDNFEAARAARNEIDRRTSRSNDAEAAASL